MAGTWTAFFIGVIVGWLIVPRILPTFQRDLQMWAMMPGYGPPGR